ncbi:hypothetical protein KC957_00945 [Candidatus Saccharibacteria bacterium]|nr:hypothetical protein [Candidatus Saccharibacteria bacterium]
MVSIGGAAAIYLLLTKKPRSLVGFLRALPWLISLAFVLYFVVGFSIAPIAWKTQDRIFTPYVIEAINDQCELEIEELSGEFDYDSGYGWQSNQSDLRCHYAGEWACSCK